MRLLLVLLAACSAPPKTELGPCPKLPDTQFNYERPIYYPMIPAIKWPQDQIPQ